MIRHLKINDHPCHRNEYHSKFVLSLLNGRLSNPSRYKNDNSSLTPVEFYFIRTASSCQLYCTRGLWTYYEDRPVVGLPKPYETDFYNTSKKKPFVFDCIRGISPFLFQIKKPSEFDKEYDAFHWNSRFHIIMRSNLVKTSFLVSQSSVKIT